MSSEEKVADMPVAEEKEQKGVDDEEKRNAPNDELSMGINMAYAEHDSADEPNDRDATNTAAGSALPRRESNKKGRCGNVCEVWSPRNRLIDTVYLDPYNKLASVAAWCAVFGLLVNMSKHPRTAEPCNDLYAHKLITGLLLHDVKIVAFIPIDAVQFVICFLHAVYHCVASTCNYLYYEHLLHHTRYMAHARAFLLSFAFQFGFLLVSGAADVAELALLMILNGAGLCLMLHAELVAFGCAEVLNGHSMLPLTNLELLSAPSASIMQTIPDYRVAPIRTGLATAVGVFLRITACCYPTAVAFGTGAQPAACMLLAVIWLDFVIYEFVATYSQRWFKWNAAKNELTLSVCLHALSVVYVVSLLYTV